MRVSNQKFDTAFNVSPCSCLEPLTHQQIALVTYIGMPAEGRRIQVKTMLVQLKKLQEASCEEPLKSCTLVFAPQPRPS